MEIVTIRRDGDDRVVPLPDRPETADFGDGTSVVIRLTAEGDLLLVPEARWRERIQAIGRQVIAEHREAFDLLTAYDHGEATVVDGELRRLPASAGED